MSTRSHQQEVDVIIIWILKQVVTSCKVTYINSKTSICGDSSCPTIILTIGKSGCYSTVSIEYTLKLDDGSVADSNVGGDPLVYTQGQSQILPALESALTGLKAEDSKMVTLSAEDGYGPVREEAFQEMPVDMLPESGRHVGAQLVGRGPSGEPVFARVVEINEGNAKVDLNHPLAGQQLHFDVKVISVE